MVFVFFALARLPFFGSAQLANLLCLQSRSGSSAQARAVATLRQRPRLCFGFGFRFGSRPAAAGRRNSFDNSSGLFTTSVAVLCGGRWFLERRSGTGDVVAGDRDFPGSSASVGSGLASGMCISAPRGSRLVHLHRFVANHNQSLERSATCSPRSPLWFVIVTNLSVAPGHPS